VRPIFYFGFDARAWLTHTLTDSLDFSACRSSFVASEKFSQRIGRNITELKSDPQLESEPQLESDSEVKAL
jgi:hypothetical protein